MSVLIQKQIHNLKNINFHIENNLPVQETCGDITTRFRNPETNRMNLIGSESHKRLLKYTTSVDLIPMIELHGKKMELQTAWIPGLAGGNLSYYGKIHPYYNVPIKTRSML